MVRHIHSNIEHKLHKIMMMMVVMMIAANTVLRKEDDIATIRSYHAQLAVLPAMRLDACAGTAINRCP